MLFELWFGGWSSKKRKERAGEQSGTPWTGAPIQVTEGTKKLGGGVA